jgi:Uncharacterized conserved protein
MSTFKKYKPIIIFTCFAFLIPVGCLLMMKSIPILEVGIGYLLLFGIFAISPTLAAILTITLNKENLSDFLKRCFWLYLR